jgi:hypothetical protein
VAFGQTFGRFGYVPASGVPGWKITAHGFQCNVPVADEFVFPAPLPAWKPTATSAQAQIVDLGDEPTGGPTQLKMDLSVPGFSLYFPKGIDLQIGSIGAPFLSWPEGSVEQTVSTPATAWVLVSFRQGQPPVLFSFPDQQSAMIVDGEPGKWHLRTIGSFSGWVRVLLPLGLNPLSAATASSLGDMVGKVVKDQALWSGPAPVLLNTKVTSDATSVTATWTYDKAGAQVPQAALLAGFGGYPLHLTTKISQLESSSEEGPRAITKEPALSIRFPLHPFTACRYLAVGVGPDLPTGSLDVKSASNLAFAALSSDFSSDQNAGAGASLMAFLSGAHGAVEPYSGDHLPYAANGAGYDLAAAHALLTQAMAISNGTASLQNPLLAEVLARIDSYSWQPWGVDDAVWRRGAALASLASEMRPEPAQRLQGAMLQAGLSAERGLDLWHYWRGDITKLPPRLEVLENLRRSIFSLQGAVVSDPLSLELRSGLRNCGPGPLQISQKDDKWFLNWMALDASPSELVLSGPAGVKFGVKRNLTKAMVVQKGSTYTVHYTPTASGACALQLILPVGSAPPPARVADGYVEISR